MWTFALLRFSFRPPPVVDKPLCLSTLPLKTASASSGGPKNLWLAAASTRSRLLTYLLLHQLLLILLPEPRRPGIPLLTPRVQGPAWAS